MFTHVYTYEHLHVRTHTCTHTYLGTRFLCELKSLTFPSGLESFLILIFTRVRLYGGDVKIDKIYPCDFLLLTKKTKRFFFMSVKVAFRAKSTPP